MRDDLSRKGYIAVLGLEKAVSQLTLGDFRAMRSPKEILADVLVLRRMHQRKLLGGEIMPEDALIPVVPPIELPETITLGMSLNYQRNSYALWTSIARLYADEESRWTLSPLSCQAAEIDRLASVLLRYRVALQPNKHPQIWWKVASSIAKFGGSMNLISLAGNEVARVRDLICGAEKKGFPYLSGPKIFNYWLYVMEQYAGVKWIDRHEISVAPDTHVIKASVFLGLVDESSLEGSELDRHRVAQAWRDLLDGSGLVPIDIHTPLWLWSRAGFPRLITKDQ